MVLNSDQIIQIMIRNILKWFLVHLDSGSDSGKKLTDSIPIPIPTLNKPLIPVPIPIPAC